MPLPATPLRGDKAVCNVLTGISDVKKRATGAVLLRK
nr:MAG TPA: hypothetical protein [Caudoviricetes sp.]DAR95325.1 MAG TPA: hypothetical protein [Caudoviricetes sp.]